MQAKVIVEHSGSDQQIDARPRRGKGICKDFKLSGREVQCNCTQHQQRGGEARQIQVSPEIAAEYIRMAASGG